MAFLILALAVLLGIAGGALLLYDGKQRTSTPTPATDADPSSVDPAPADATPTNPTPTDSASSSAAPENAAPAEPADSGSSVAPKRGPAADPATPASVSAPTPEPKPEPTPKPAPETPPQQEPESTDEPEPAPEREPTPESEHQSTLETASEHSAPSKPHARHRPILPGTMRRERRNWAEAKGFEFMKADPYLVDEWTRGVASTGAAPKDIVAGNVYGHEMLLMDIDGVNVMAMRTGAASDMVVDFRRFDRDDAKASEDLLLAMTIEGFDVYSSDSAVTERMVDERVHVALQQMPEAVTALWMETEWVLAQTTKQARSAEWDAMLPPLALLADAARVLPPRSSATHVVRLEELDPAREIPAQPIVEVVGGAPAAGAPEFERPVIQRPEEPLQMPSRAYSETRGPVEHSALGGDEVDAIADGRERPTPDSHTARLPRQQFRAASIFDSPSADSTTDGPRAADPNPVDPTPASESAAEESDPRRGE
ncbi:hypothetical protein [Corynebacterium tuberculostearicum]|uniref:hypothetical protein n=1 Tax=Corynebacterium tuberculostearicum TaxID=38304 RepID=UPI0017F9C93A|nr:hypothetical protein [Corynebacterium tuberculostearicum]NYI56364.1 hypothetical protein [Corynebacterium tuberculostearicum]